jgi:acetyl esterase
MATDTHATEEVPFEVETEDVEYLRHGDTPLLARIYRPRGRGPFPAVIDAHGGAWWKIVAFIRSYAA